jgi:hypothetical protein
MVSFFSIASLPDARPHLSAPALKWGLGGTFAFSIAMTFALFGLPKANIGVCQTSAVLPIFGDATTAAMSAKRGMACPISLRSGALVIEDLNFIEKPTNGTVTVQGHRGLSYTSHPDFEGEDSFVVSLNGIYGHHQGSAIIRVKVNVN